jgi:hypothetical protein
MKKLFDQLKHMTWVELVLGFLVDIHSRCARAYLSGVYAVVKGQARGDLLVAHNVICASMGDYRVCSKPDRKARS